LRELRNRVVQLKRFGDADELEVVDAAMPMAASGEVRVRDRIGHPSWWQGAPPQQANVKSVGHGAASFALTYFPATLPRREARPYPGLPNPPVQ
jgi:hypothetical protein